MVVDTRSNELSPKDSYDVCIVGAGAAGIPLALELAKSDSCKVAILEAGGLEYEAEVQDMYAGEVVGDRHPSLRRARYAGFGGSTELWAGWSRPLDRLDFEKRDWVNDSGWPIGFDELSDYFDKANRWCGLGSLGYGLDEWESEFDGDSLADGELVEDRLFRVRRLSFRSEYANLLEENEQVDVLLYATTLRFRSDEGGSMVQSAAVVLGDGRRVEIKAKKFVLASGGLENPRLLLLSGDCPERAVGNSRGLVGKYFTEHGFVDSGWFRAFGDGRRFRKYFPVSHPDGEVYGTARHVLALSDKVLERERLNNAIMYFYPGYEASSSFDRDAVKSALELWEILKKQAVPGDWSKIVKEIAGGPHHVLWAAFRKAFAKEKVRRDWRLRCYYECIPNRENRVELGDDLDRFGRRRSRLVWKLGSEDLRRVKRFHEVMNHSLVERGIGELTFLESESEWRQKTESGKHPMGTTRMHASPELGVVDADCRVHGVHNLYVAGSSVFPATGYANPTLTIVALALRLADHLKSTQASF